MTFSAYPAKVNELPAAPPAPAPVIAIMVHAVNVASVILKGIVVVPACENVFADVV